MYWIGYFGGSFLIVWGIVCLVTIGKIRRLQEDEKKEYKKKRLFISLLIGVVLGAILLILRTWATG